MTEVNATASGATVRRANSSGRRVFEVVCDDIRHQVTRGFLRPGDKLPAERELAERLGVSRAAVREALRALEASGVLEFRKGVHGGAFVRKASSSGIRSSIADMLSLGRISLEHLSETRSILLTAAARHACERGTEEDFVLLEKNVQRSTELMALRGSDEGIITVTEFYHLLGNASHNGVLKIIIEAVSDVAREIILRLRPGQIAHLPQARREIIAALRERDGGKAETLMALHMAEIHAYVVAHGGAAALSKAQSPIDAVADRTPNRKSR